MGSRSSERKELQRKNAKVYLRVSLASFYKSKAVCEDEALKSLAEKNC